MPSHVLFILTSQATLGEDGAAAGTWLEELAAAYWVLQQGGCSITLSSVRGGKAPLDPASLDAPWLTDRGKALLADAAIMAKLDATPSLDTLDIQQFDAVYLVGGAAVMWDFPVAPVVGKVLRQCADGGRVIAAVCHGVAGLLNSQGGSALVTGRSITCISNAEDAAAGYDKLVPFMPEEPLRKAGARLSFAAELFAEHAVRDGTLVTGQNPASAGACGRLIIEALAERNAKRALPVA